MMLVTGGSGPHAGQSVAASGAALEAAVGAVIMLHGRGGDAGDMLGLAPLVAGPQIAVIAPNAAGRTWYPHAFTAPVSRNEPYLSSALSVVADLIGHCVRGGLPARRIVLLGFSQGACLALESAARWAGPLGAVVGLSGGLIGETISGVGLPRHEGLPVFLGCAERDPHIPLARVRETEAVFRGLGAVVSVRIYPGGDHTINADEIDFAKRFIARAAQGDTAP
jgi:phospholipase/carboxylesterase/glyoxalase family protein